MNRTIQPIAVTGLGCISACGHTVSECYDALLRGERNPSGPALVRTEHETSYPVFEILDHPALDDRDCLKNNRTTAIALIAVAEALQDAGWTKKELKTQRIGISLGTTVGCAMNNEEFNRIYHQGAHPSMNEITRYLSSNAAQVIAQEYGVTGPCQTVNNACSSGTDAIGIGASWIRAGLCDIVIAGGADELSRITFTGFVSLLNVSEAPCQPFDKNRKGLNLGEGAGIVILERTPRVPAKAMVIGYGSACDAYHLTAPTPDGGGLRRAIDAALTQGGKTPDDISFVNAHGTGTLESDRIEGRVLGDLFSSLPFMSTKGYTGHTLGAAGGIEAVFTIVGLMLGMLPSNIGFDSSDPEIGTDPITEVSAVNGRTALSESLAFGGNNSVILFEKAQP